MVLLSAKINVFINKLHYYRRMTHLRLHRLSVYVVLFEVTLQFSLNDKQVILRCKEIKPMSQLIVSLLFDSLIVCDFVSTREFFTQSPLPVKGYKFEPILGTHGH